MPTAEPITPISAGEAFSFGVGTVQFLGIMGFLIAVAVIWIGAYAFKKFRRSVS